jgi:predicted membrane-bound spermidine synthase
MYLSLGRFVLSTNCKHAKRQQIALYSNEVDPRRNCPYQKIIYYRYFGTDSALDLLTNWRDEKRYASFELGLGGVRR